MGGNADCPSPPRRRGAGDTLCGRWQCILFTVRVVSHVGMILLYFPLFSHLSVRGRCPCCTATSSPAIHSTPRQYRTTCFGRRVYCIYVFTTPVRACERRNPPTYDNGTTFAVCRAFVRSILFCSCQSIGLERNPSLVLSLSFTRKDRQR